MTAEPMEKITFNMPADLKAQVMALKDDLHLSLSAIYNEAIRSYIRQKELEKWERGVERALNDSAYKTLIAETGGDTGDLHEY